MRISNVLLIYKLTNPCDPIGCEGLFFFISIVSILYYLHSIFVLLINKYFMYNFKFY